MDYYRSQINLGIENMTTITCSYPLVVTERQTSLLSKVRWTYSLVFYRQESIIIGQGRQPA